MRSNRLVVIFILLICVFCFATPAALAYTPPGFGGGSGTAGDPYQIKTVADLASLANDVSAANDYTDNYFIVVNDIDFEGQSIVTLAGQNITYFNGVFDGNSKTISNMTATMDIANAGLFGSLKPSGIIKDLNLKNFSITTTIGSATLQLGTLAGSNAGMISGCFAQGDLSGHNTQTTSNYYSKVGGLVGVQF